MRKSRAERFWARVDRSGECWLWTGTLFRSGYGCASVGGRNVRAHRYAWSLEHGEIPDGLFVLHRCDNPACVRPDHLFLGTNADNVLDAVAKGRYRNQNSDRTHCRRGHPFDEANTHVYDGRRRCRQCQKDGEQARRNAQPRTYASSEKEN